MAEDDTIEIPDLPDSPDLGTALGVAEYAASVDGWLDAIGRRDGAMTDAELDRYEVAQHRLEIGALRTRLEFGAPADPEHQAATLAAARELALRASMDLPGGGSAATVDSARMFRDAEYRKEQRGQSLEGIDTQMLSGPGDERWAVSLAAARNFVVARSQGISPKDIVDARRQGIALVARNGRIVERATFETGTVGAGADWIPDEFAASLYTTFFDFGGMRQCGPYTDITPNGREKTYYTVSTVVDAGTSVTDMITAEGAAYDEKTDTTGAVSSKCVKATALIPMTNEMIADSGFELSGYAGDSMGRTIAQKVEYAGLFGNGSLTAGTVQPEGIMYVDTTVTDQTYTAAANTKLTVQDMLGWIYSPLEGLNENNLRGLMKRNAWGNFRRQAATDGHLVVDLTTGVAPHMLEGSRFLFSPYLPAIAASKELGVLGDWGRGSIYREVDSIIMVRDPYSDIKSGKINWLAEFRFDFRVRDNRSFSWLATPS